MKKSKKFISPEQCQRCQIISCLFGLMFSSGSMKQCASDGFAVSDLSLWKFRKSRTSFLIECGHLSAKSSSILTRIILLLRSQVYDRYDRSKRSEYKPKDNKCKFWLTNNIYHIKARRMSSNFVKQNNSWRWWEIKVVRVAHCLFSAKNEARESFKTNYSALLLHFSSWEYH